MRTRSIILAVGLAIAATSPTLAQKKYDAGASDTEIKIGQTMRAAFELQHHRQARERVL